MITLEQIKQEVINEILSDKITIDLGDLGNTIGFIVGKYTNEGILGDKEDFIHGIKHGISLSDGTHP